MIVSVASISFILWPAPIAAARAKVCKVDAVSYPGKDPVMWDGVYAAKDGKVYTGLITEGSGTNLFVYDPAIGKNRLLCDVANFLGERGKGIRTSSKIHNKPVEDDEGNIYFATLNNGGGPRNIDFTSWEGGHWFKYDPKTDRVENLGLIDEAAGVYPLVLDKKRLRLYGIGFTGYFYRFDIKNRIATKVGRVCNWDICRNIFIDDLGNVYGSFPPARIWKYDVEKERIYDLPSVRAPYDPTFFPVNMVNPMLDRTRDWRAIQWDPTKKVAYGITCGSGSTLFRYDPHDGPEGKVTALAKMCDPRFIRSGEKAVPYSTLAFALDSINQMVYFVPSAREYSLDAYVETYGSDEPHHLMMYDLKTDQLTDLGYLKAKDGRRIFGCEGAAVAPDGTVYICGQVEVKDPRKGTRFMGKEKIPATMGLIVYKPK